MRVKSVISKCKDCGKTFVAFHEEDNPEAENIAKHKVYIDRLFCKHLHPTFDKQVNLA